MKKILTILLFSLTFSLFAHCEIFTSKELAYLKEDFNKDSICREFSLELTSKLQSVELQKIKIQVNSIERFRVNYQFSAETSQGELTGVGTHFWFPGDSFAKISLQ